MQKNFTIHGAFAELVVGEMHIDLHNCYNVKSIATHASGDAVTLEFQRDHPWDGPDGLPEEVTLICSGNLKIAFNDLVDIPVPLREDAVEIGYYGQHCDWDELLDEKLAADQGFEGLHISFSGGFVLRIRSGLAEATTR